MNRMLFFFCLLIIVLTITNAFAADTTATIRWVDASKFPRITVFVSVYDSDGKSISGLSEKDFSIEEDGMGVAIKSASSVLSENPRLAIALLIDCSGSMKGKAFSQALAAANDFVSRLSQQDLITATTFARKPLALLTPTTDHKAALAALHTAKVGGNTSLWDTILDGINTLAPIDASRKAIILLTDGYDTSSKSSMDDCKTAAFISGIAIYSVILGNNHDYRQLEELATNTSGFIYTTVTPSNLRTIYQQIAADLRNEYILSYQAPEESQTSTWRTSKVRVTLDEDETIKATRQYLAPVKIGALPSNKFGDLPSTLTTIIVLLILMNLALLGLLYQRMKRATSHD